MALAPRPRRFDQVVRAKPLLPQITRRPTDQIDCPGGAGSLLRVDVKTRDMSKDMDMSQVIDLRSLDMVMDMVTDMVVDTVTGMDGVRSPEHRRPHPRAPPPRPRLLCGC